MGSGTMDAIKTYKPSNERVRCYRLKHYYDLVNSKPEQERFLFGWYKRVGNINLGENKWQQQHKEHLSVEQEIMSQT